MRLCFAQELFTALLMCPVEDLGASDKVSNEDDPRKTCDITVADIMGPLILLNKEVGTGASAAADCMDQPRDANFSLLSYSFSLVGPARALNPCGVGLATSPRQYIQRCSRVHKGNTCFMCMWCNLRLISNFVRAESGAAPRA